MRSRRYRRALWQLGAVAFMATSGVAAEFLYPQPAIRMAWEPLGVITLDLDGDGLLDVVSANRDSDDVAVLLGHGDGTFAVPKRYPACGGGGPGWSTPGDFDENGTIDLAVACHFSGLVSILLGDGTGAFGPSAEYGETHYGPFSVHTGDFNNDDHLDLIAANYFNAGSVTMLLGNGDGTFGSELVVGFGQTTTVAVGDFDADGNDDFAYPKNGNLQVHLGNGDGTFAAPLLFPGDGYHLLPVDLDGDEILDLVAAESPDRILVLLGRGDGTFAPGQAYPTYDSYPVFVSAADFDGDQLLDLAVLSHYSAESPVSLLYGTGGGEFGPAVGFEPAGDSAWSHAVGDFDRDGALDIVRPFFSGDYLSVLFGDSSGGIRSGLRETVDVSPSDVAVADLDGDSRPDIAVSNEGADTVSILLAEGAGTFEPEVRYPTGRGPSAIVTGEFSGDSLPDLVTSNRVDNNCSLLVGTGGGGFAGAGSFSLGLASGPSDLAVGDFNEDGLDDLAVTMEGSNTVSLLLGLGNGPFTAPRFVPVGTAPVSIVVADLDGDDHDDLAVANRGSDDVFVLLGKGDGTFASSANVPVGSSPTALAVGDIDSDGNMDLAVVHEGCVDLRIYSGDGAGGFTEAQVIPIEDYCSYPAPVIVTDMNDDGFPDVGVGTSFRMHALINMGGGVLEFDAGYAIRRVASGIVGADFNGDALQDLVVANKNNYDLTILLNQSGPDILGFTADASTLVWPAVTGALSYNVYRGDLDGLIDLDEDGLPDGGYGTCMTPLDSDPTDTFFDDPDLPSSDAGFFYLRSVVDAEGEGSLGTTSAGLPREPAVACP